MTKDDRITWAVGFFWLVTLIGMFVLMSVMAGCCHTKIKTVTKTEWKDRIITVKERCPCLVEQLPKPDLWLLRVEDWDTLTDEQAARMIKHDNGELVKYAEAMKIACKCPEEP